MGGVFNVPCYLKDTNFGLDPEAAHAVLTSGAPVTLVPMDVTTQTQMLHADLDRLAKQKTGLAVIWHKPFDHGLHTLCKPAICTGVGSTMC